MRIILSKKIQKKEKFEIKNKDLHKLKSNLFSTIKGKNLPKNSRLIKLYLTTKSGPKRIVFLHDIKKNDMFLLFYRDKKDFIGRNICMNNIHFHKSLKTHLNLLNEDLKTHNYKIILI